MKLKKEVEIVLIVLFVIAFFGLGSYIGLKNFKGEKIVNFDLEKVFSAAKDSVPQVTILPEEADNGLDAAKEPFEESPKSVVDQEEITTVIEIKDTKFYPSELSVSVGTTVTWVNKDPNRNYKVYERAMPQRFNSFRIEPEKEFSYLFNETGVYEFSDAIFKYMKGKIVVTDE
jgi:plastocyanin